MNYLRRLAGGEFDGLPLYLVDPESSQIRFTDAGIARYRERFGRAGIDIRRIGTLDELQHALEESFPIEWDAAISIVSTGEGDSIERRLLVATATGNVAEVEKLKGLLGERKHLFKGALRRHVRDD